MSNNESWGQRMINRGPSAYFNNDGTPGVQTASIISSVSGTVNDVRWYNLGLGATDAEATTVNTNDTIMIVANGRSSSTNSTDWGESSTGFAGVGVKRSQVSGGYPASYTFNGTGGDSKAGVIANPGVYNGNISFDTDGYITCYAAIQ